MITASQLPSMAFKNKGMVERSAAVGCYRCCKVLSPSDVTSHTDQGQTCVCPGCGHDCLVGDSCGFVVTEESMRHACKVIFG